MRLGIKLVEIKLVRGSGLVITRNIGKNFLMQKK